MKAFENIIGYEDIKEELYRVCDIMKDPEKYRRIGVYTPRGVLLHGIPGVGKTMMAKAVIKESGRKTFTIGKDQPDGDFVNVIRDTFEQARKEAPSIVFMDDMDKFANEDCMHRDAEEYVTVQACIDDSRDHEVFVLATVNNRYDLPDSLLRAGRFDKCIEVKAPSGNDAVKIIDHFLKQKKCLDNINAEDIARLIDGKSCAELETAINEAGIYAAYAGKKCIEQEDMVKACMRVIFGATESMEKMGNGTVNKIAVHEAGHAVIAEILDPGSVNFVSVSGQYGAVSGVTSVHRPEEHDYSKTLMEHSLIRHLGGKAATEIVLGITDVGCNNDLQDAFELAREFVDNFCSYGFDAFEGVNSSGYLLEKKDRMVAQEVERYYLEAKRLLIENRQMLDLLTEELLAKKILTWNDIRRIKENLKKLA